MVAVSVTALSGDAWAGLKPGPSAVDVGLSRHIAERPGFSPAATQDLPPASTQPAAPAKPAFDEWLDGVRRDALARGIRAGTIDRAFNGLPFAA